MNEGREVAIITLLADKERGGGGANSIRKQKTGGGGGTTQNLDVKVKYIFLPRSNFQYYYVHKNKTIF